MCRTSIVSLGAACSRVCVRVLEEFDSYHFVPFLPSTCMLAGLVNPKSTKLPRGASLFSDLIS